MNNMKIKFMFFKWITSLIAIFCEVINILSLTLYRPWWDYKFMSYTHSLLIKERMNKSNR